MVKGARERALQNLAYRYHLKNRKRTPKQNWRLAEKFLKKLEQRYAKS